ncbi:HdeD family acid-resistance protein [Streptacidiphilus monticola]
MAGVIMLSWPEETLRVLAIIIGLQLLGTGLWRFVTAFSHDRADGGSRVLYILLSLLAVLAGVLVLRHQLQTVGVLALIVGAYWLIGGLVTAFVAIGSRGLPHRGLLLFLAGLGVVAGIVVLAYPVGTAVALARLLGLWLVLLGGFELIVAVAMRISSRSRPRG